MFDLTDLERVQIPPSASADWHLSPHTQALLSRVAATDLPVLCTECYGPAFERVALLLHRASGREELVLVDLRASGGVLPAGLPAGARAARTTLALDGVEVLTPGAQSVLARELDSARWRMVSAIDVPFDALGARLRPDLLSLLSTVVVRTPALARQGEEIGDLARRRVAALCVALRHAAAELAPSAIDALARHAWAGDLAELDAVLVRTLLATDGPTIEGGDLRFRPDVGDLPQPAPAREPARAEAVVAPREVPSRAEGARDDASPTLEALAVELAHQLKNPLVTIKTFVASIDALCEDPHDLRQFRALTDEAVSRMDEILDGLLSFARLAPAAPVELDVLPLLRDALRAAWAGFASKQVTLDAPDGAALNARVDAEHLRFALAALARHVAETIEPRGTLRVEVEPGPALRFAYRESGAITHLRGVARADDESLPLALLLVRGALGRVGGGVDITLEDTAVVIRLRLAPP